MVAANIVCSAGPILLLIFLMTKKAPMSAAKALPLAAAVTSLLQFAWFQADAGQVHASILAGLLVALTPILIVWCSCFSPPALAQPRATAGGPPVVRVKSSTGDWRGRFVAARVRPSG